ncbi:MAG: TonB-dependent receptor [Cyclobacteriaceae bacterium]
MKPGLTLLLVIVGTHLLAANLQGTITDDENNPLPGATVIVVGTTTGVTTDSDGFYEIRNLEAGTYTIAVSMVGFETLRKETSVTQNEVQEVNFTLTSGTAELDEVMVIAESEAKRLSSNPLQISSIDVVKLQNESADVVTVLNRTAGVRVRQSGGLGSQTNIQLNGLTGQAVRTYIDGIPLALYGGSIQINNIPVNAIERVDVYKGVMPIDVGTDALAGGINVVSRQVDYDYLDASYQLGSFNTHIGSLNASRKFGEHIIVSVNSFYNYSDNNYSIRAQQRTPDFKEEEVEAERFHSAHQSSMVQGTIGLVNTHLADKLTYSVGYNQRYDEIQHGVRIGNRAVGEADLERNALVHNLQYQKTFFKDKLLNNYFGKFSIAKEFVDDSTTNVYNWFGEIVATNNQGMEVLGLPSQREGETRSQAHRVNLEYSLSSVHTIKLSSFLSDQKVVGNDPLAPAIGGIDPNTVPSFLTRSISGIAYESKWFDAKLESILFGKYYYYDQSTADFRAFGGDQVFEYAADGRETGYGMGLKYSFLKDLFIRASYEQAIRIPTKEEVFGDFLTIEPNFFLKPEESQNLNVGGYFKHSFNASQFISIDANWFLRDQTNLIRLEPGRNENDPAQFVNEAEADATGVELMLTVAPLRDWETVVSFTSQEVVKAGIPNQNNTNGVGNLIPNIPSTFFNVSSRYTFSSPISEEDEVTVFGYYTFVDEFDLIFQTTRNEENIIPIQRQLDLGLSYRLADSGFTFSIQMNNVLDEEVFDNFRVPRPGRNANLKIRYLLHK